MFDSLSKIKNLALEIDSDAFNRGRVVSRLCTLLENPEPYLRQPDWCTLQAIAMAKSFAYGNINKSVILDMESFLLEREEITMSEIINLLKKYNERQENE